MLNQPVKVDEWLANILQRIAPLSDIVNMTGVAPKIHQRLLNVLQRILIPSALKTFTRPPLSYWACCPAFQQTHVDLSAAPAALGGEEVMAQPPSATVGQETTDFPTNIKTSRHSRHGLTPSRPQLEGHLPQPTCRRCFVFQNQGKHLLRVVNIPNELIVAHFSHPRG
jgi:hypothetical protein